MVKKLKNHDMDEETLNEIVHLAREIQDLVNSVNKYKDHKKKLNNCTKALLLLEKLELLEGHKKVIPNYDEMIDKISRIHKVLPMLLYIDQAERYQFKRNYELEKDALLDAMYEIKSNKITNKDFIIAEARQDSGEIISIEKISSRLKELGWSEE